MLVKRLKEWITSLLGLLLLAGAAYMLYLGKITMGEFSAFLPVTMMLFWAKNSFLTDIFKRGSGGAAVLIILLLAVGCRSQRLPSTPLPPTVTTSSSTNTVTQGGESQQGYTKPDSASIKALLYCDSLGNVQMRYIAELLQGKNVKPEVRIQDNYIYVKCTVDSAEVWNKWSRFYNLQSDTSTHTVYLPGTVLVTNILTWWQQVFVVLGKIFGALLIPGIIYIVYKLKF